VNADGPGAKKQMAVIHSAQPSSLVMALWAHAERLSLMIIPINPARGDS